MPRTLHYEIDLDSGVIVSEVYRLDGELHRDPMEGPAYLCRVKDRSGTYFIYQERYYWHGKLHRENGPAKIEYGNGHPGPMTDEIYYRHGLLHRDPKIGPAHVERLNEAIIITERYYFYGKLWRNPADGPCEIVRYDDGSVEYEEFSESRAGPSRGRVQRKKSGLPPAP